MKLSSLEKKNLKTFLAVALAFFAFFLGAIVWSGKSAQQERYETQKTASLSTADNPFTLKRKTFSDLDWKYDPVRNVIWTEVPDKETCVLIVNTSTVPAICLEKDGKYVAVKKPRPRGQV